MYTSKKQFKVQIIGILEEIDSFYWPKMHLWKGDKKIGQGPPPPHLDKIQKNSNFFLETFPKFQLLLTRPYYHFLNNQHNFFDKILILMFSKTV